MYIPNHIPYSTVITLKSGTQTTQWSCHENHHHPRKKGLSGPMPKHFLSNKEKAKNPYLNIRILDWEMQYFHINFSFSCLLGTFNISEERRKLTSNAVWQTHKMGLHISDLCLLEPSKSTVKTCLSQAPWSRASSAIFREICVQRQVITFTAQQELTLPALGL